MEIEQRALGIERRGLCGDDLEIVGRAVAIAGERQIARLLGSRGGLPLVALLMLKIAGPRARSSSTSRKALSTVCL